jgi:hypothetical protein
MNRRRGSMGEDYERGSMMSTGPSRAAGNSQGFQRRRLPQAPELTCELIVIQSKTTTFERASESVGP